MSARVTRVPLPLLRSQVMRSEAPATCGGQAAPREGVHGVSRHRADAHSPHRQTHSHAGYTRNLWRKNWNPRMETPHGKRLTTADNGFLWLNTAKYG